MSDVWQISSPCYAYISCVCLLYVTEMHFSIFFSGTSVFPHRTCPIQFTCCCHLGCWDLSDVSVLTIKTFSLVPKWSRWQTDSNGKQRLGWKYLFLFNLYRIAVPWHLVQLPDTQEILLQIYTPTAVSSSEHVWPSYTHKLFDFEGIFLHLVQCKFHSISLGSRA